MLIGKGMIARRFNDFADRDNVVIFASGVSNSKETRPEPYARERQLVEQTLEQTLGCLFVYFSTASVADPIEVNSPYVKHKLELEQLIASRARYFLIVRASNVVGGPGNPHTILNFFVDRVRSGEPFSIWQYATRNIIDLDDVYTIVTSYIANKQAWNQTIVVANPVSISPLAIVQAIEQHTGQKAVYELLDKGSPFALPTDSISHLLQTIGKDWEPEQYIARLLKKYYA